MDDVGVSDVGEDDVGDVGEAGLGGPAWTSATLGESRLRAAEDDVDGAAAAPTRRMGFRLLRPGAQTWKSQTLREANGD